MPFVTQFGSKQYIVDYNQKFAVDRITDIEEGDVIDVPVLISFGDSSKIQKIKAKVLSHTKGKKIRVVKFRSKSNYHRQYGFRACITILQVVGKDSKNSQLEFKENSKTTDKAAKIVEIKEVVTTKKVITKEVKLAKE